MSLTVTHKLRCQTGAFWMCCILLALVALISCSNKEEIEFFTKDELEQMRASWPSSSDGSSSSALKGCEESVFNSDEYFCYDGRIYDKCKGMEYNPSTHICQGNSAEPAKCDNTAYNPLTQDCCRNKEIYSMEKQFCDARDGNIYKYAKIGDQTWMAKNLNYNADGSRCYGDYPANCTNYGRLYNLKTSKEACPSGWHLPSDEEWQSLVNYTGRLSTKLKATSGWNDYSSSSGNGTDDYSFSALPGGGYGNDGNNTSEFINIGNNGYWWNSNSDYYMLCRNDCDDKEKLNLASIRCVKD